MTEWGLWVLSNVVTAHQEITRGLFAQLEGVLIRRTEKPGGRTTPKGTKPQQRRKKKR